MGLIFLLLAGAGLALPGCSKQGEGERCSPNANGSEDCDDGLVCKEDKTVSDFGRCCPPEGAELGDSRCNFTSTPGSTGGSSSGGASNAGTSGGGTSTGGTSTGGTNDSGEGGSGATSGAAAAGSEAGGASGAGGA
jgi:hypothetical protein